MDVGATGVVAKVQASWAVRWTARCRDSAVKESQTWAGAASSAAAGRRSTVSRAGIMWDLLLLSLSRKPRRHSASLFWILAKTGHKVHRPPQPIEIEQG